jgi:hypothetical protein
MFFLVSGAAASGKSTLLRNISNQIGDLECHDHDEKRVVDQYTRCQQLEQWVQSALKFQQESHDFLLVSHSPLGELLACPSAPKLTGISACLLDCSDTVRITRIRNRGIDPRWPPTQHVLNWASWHRMHAWDPQWEQHVIVGNGPADHAYERWTHWKQNDARWQVNVIDTTDIDAGQVLKMAVAWIHAERGKTPLLAPDTKWWE